MADEFVGPYQIPQLLGDENVARVSHSKTLAAAINAGFTKVTLDASWDRGALAAGTDLNALTASGQYRVDKGGDVSTILNKPTNVSNPFSVSVSIPSTTNNIVVQRLTTWGATGEPITYERQSLGGAFSGWVLRDWDRGTLAAGTDLNKLTEPGRYRANKGSDAISMLNRPAAATNPFTVEVSRLSTTNDIIVQRLTVWVQGGSPATYERQSLGGVFDAWDEKPGSKLDQTTIAVFGDSLSENASGASWVEQANPLLTDTTLVNFARSGDDSNTVLIRAGVKRLKFKVAGGTIPASGSVALTTSEKLSLRENRAVVGGSIAGVPGTLTHTTGNAFTFARTTAGTAVTASGWQDFTTGITTTVGIVLGWFGANDFIFDVKHQERSLADHIIASYDTFVAWARATGRTPLIAGVTNQRTHLAGTDWFAQVQEINRTLRQRYPGIFLDVQAYLVERAIYDAGLTPTAAELAGMARGEIPAQLYTDTVHFSNPARTALGTKWLAPWLAAQGHARTTQTLAALPTLKPVDELSVNNTGWFDVSTGLINGWTGELHVRREGNTVWYRARNLSSAAATAHAFYQQVEGLRVYSTYPPAGTDALVYTDSIARACRDRSHPALNNFWRYWSFVSDEPTPAAMPGVAV